MRRFVSLALALTAAAVVAGISGSATSSGDLTRLSNRGHVTARVAPLTRRILLRAGAVGPVRTIAVRGTHRYYRVSRRSGRDCFGVGAKTPRGDHFSLVCSAAFPSPDRPILDSSVFGAEAGESLHVITVEGFAADGVATIGLENAAGIVARRIPVIGNVYRLGTVPPGLVRVVAFDADGKVLFAVPK
jgi:hypothetical protein